MYNAKAYSAASATSPLASTTIPRRDPTERDVQIEILFCGICHSDLHQARDEWHERHADRLPVRARPRDRRPGHQGRLSRHQVQARRPGRRSAAWSIPTAPARTARRGSSSSART